MSFNDFLKSGWSDHALRAAEVAERFPEGIGLVDEGGQIAPLANLIAHVTGEHLGEWERGIRLLSDLRQCRGYEPQGESGRAVSRAVLSLELAGGLEPSQDPLPLSDAVRALAMAGAALSGQKQTARAGELFQEALNRLAELPRDDAAYRALAITGNNLACALEEQAARSETENNLMILAAKSARRCWEIAGTWLETERAEYRLAQSYLKAERPEEALRHARLCLKISEDHQAPALELFFACEALVLAERACGRPAEAAVALERMKRHFTELSADDQAWCRASLTRLAGDSV